MKRIIQITFSLLLISTISYTQISNEFIDARDSTIYKTITIDSTEWMADNLNYKMDGAYYYSEDCDACGLLYTYEAAEKACPENFRLPTKDEWNNLFVYLNGQAKASTDGVFYYGVKDTLMQSDFLNLKLCGFFIIDPSSTSFIIEFSFCKRYGAYWHQNENIELFEGIHFEKVSTWLGPVEGDAYSGFSVKCVKRR